MEKRKLLIVVDMQNDFTTGSLSNRTACAIIPNIKAEMEDPSYTDFIFTRDTHFKNYMDTQEGKNLPIPHCIIHTEGHDIVDELKNTPQYKKAEIIDKKTFGYISWYEYIKRTPYDEIVLVGTCTDICVISNALILKNMYPETVVSVKESCCAGLTKEKHDCAIEVMKSCQINII